MLAEAEVTIVNKRGLHARAAAKFVKTATAYAAKITVVKCEGKEYGDCKQAEGSEILDLLMLGADIGSKLHLKAEGEQAKEGIAALCGLVEDKFGEEE